MQEKTIFVVSCCLLAHLPRAGVKGTDWESAVSALYTSSAVKCVCILGKWDKLSDDGDSRWRSCPRAIVNPQLALQISPTLEAPRE
jgi:hypothetical protein